jgi:hypothetical protein
VKGRAAAILAFAALAASAGPARAAEGDYSFTPDGRAVRTRFDPASRVWASLSGLVTGGLGGPPLAAAELGAGLAYRAVDDSGVGRDRIVWQVDHRVLAGRVAPFGAGAAATADGTVYGVSAHRHDASPSLVLPLSPPVPVASPFDLGFEAELGRLTISPPKEAESEEPRLRVRVARAGLFVDPLRTGREGRSLELGASALYDVERRGRTTHYLAPLTAASARLRWQTDDGLLALDGRTEVLPRWSDGGDVSLGAESGLHVERTLAAIDDRPVIAVMEGAHRWAREDGADHHEVRVSLGLGVTWPLR